MSQNSKWFFKITPVNIIILVIGIAINFSLKLLALNLKAPVWLDSVGTAICSCILGPVGGCLAGIGNGILGVILLNNTWGYIILSIPISLIIAAAYRKNSLCDLFETLCTAFAMGIICSMLGFFITLNLEHGIINNLWGDALMQMLKQNGVTKLPCIALGELFIEIPDKILTTFIIYVLIGAKHFITNGKGESDI